MKKARYKDPKSNIEKPKREYHKDNRTLVVMCTYIPEDQSARYGSVRSKDDYRFQYLHDRLESLKFTLACYDYYKAEANYDLVIIDNDSPDKNGCEFLDSLDIPVYKRPNTYYSFGAYKYAWDKFGKDYDYFIFHEMDWVPAKDSWLKDLIDEWVADPEVGMIGNLIEGRGWVDNPTSRGQIINNRFIEKINSARLKHYNLDSEYLFTDKIVLEQMDKEGWLMFECKPQVDLSPCYNELAFQQPILEMGYKLSCYNDGKYSMFYATANRDFTDKWNHGLDKLTPFVPEQTRLFCPEMKKYFSWYKGKSSLVEGDFDEKKKNK